MTKPISATDISAIQHEYTERLAAFRAELTTTLHRRDRLAIYLMLYSGGVMAFSVLPNQLFRQVGEVGYFTGVISFALFTGLAGVVWLASFIRTRRHAKHLREEIATLEAAILELEALEAAQADAGGSPRKRRFRLWRPRLPRLRVPTPPNPLSRVRLRWWRHPDQQSNRDITHE